MRADGRICLAPGGSTLIPLEREPRPVASAGTGSLFTDIQAGSATPARLCPPGSGRGAFLVALPLTEIDNTLRNELLLLVLIAASGIALAGVLGLLVARTALAPIARFTRQTESIAASAGADRGRTARGRSATTSWPASRGPSTTTLDALERSVQAQRNLVADASHELRTPIASIRANLQLMRDERCSRRRTATALRADMIDELDELTALVGDVVELARGSKPGGEPGEVRLDEIVTEAVHRARRRAPQLSFETTLEPTLVRGEGERIARAVGNLLDNASKWSPEREVVEVELRDGDARGSRSRPGFNEQDLPFVFDRFHRAKQARSKPGSGLGLAIVRQAAEAHGGFAQAANASGGGALLRVSFGPKLRAGRRGAIRGARGLSAREGCAASSGVNKLRRHRRWTRAGLRPHREDEIVAVLSAARERDRAPASLRARVRTRARRQPGSGPAGAPHRRPGSVGAGGAVIALALALAPAVRDPGAPTHQAGGCAGDARAFEAAPGDHPPGPGNAAGGERRPGVLPRLASDARVAGRGRTHRPVGGRHAVTVYYAAVREQVAYTIVATPPLAEPAAQSIRAGSLTVRALRSGTRTVVTWRREGDTCVLSSTGSAPVPWPRWRPGAISPGPPEALSAVRRGARRLGGAASSLSATARRLRARCRRVVTVASRTRSARAASR